MDPEYYSVTPPPPKSVKIEIDARCDFQCAFCANHMRLRQKGRIDWEFFKRIAKEMRAAGVFELGVFFLGESFLNPDLPRAIQYAKQECGYPYVFLTTNGGSSVTPDKIRACIEAGLDSLKFSFNYADVAQFVRITRVKPEVFPLLSLHIRQTHEIRDDIEAKTGHHCGIYASSIQYDGEQHERMRGAVALIEPFTDECYELPLYSHAALTAGAFGTKPTAGNQGRIGALRPPLPCWSIFTEGHITFDGKLSACAFDHDGRFNMGDLNKVEFMEAWHSPAFQELRRANLEKNVCGTACEKCLAYQ